MSGGLQNWLHICVDMQRMFAEETPWQVPWALTVSPQALEIAGRHPERTLFTRFVPPLRAAEMPGQWKAYYEKWWMMTGEHLPPEMIDLVPALKRFAPPASIFDKRTYSPWTDGRLAALLNERRVDTLVVTGGETDVCVLATVLGGIDFGYRIVLLKGRDATYDASLRLLGDRFSAQVQITETEPFLASL